MDSSLRYFADMLLIRCFEETLLDAFHQGIFHGTTHTSIGQEANAVGVITQLTEDDIVVSNHRCHGHFLAYGGDPYQLFAELMGKEAGVCRGRGGSQHLHWRNFYSNGIQGGILPMAAGMALAEKIRGTQAIAAVFLGDGTLGAGVVYETLNLASLWQIPILFVLENNQIAQTTPIHLALAGNINARFEAFDIPVIHKDTSDVLEIAALAKVLIDATRIQKRPHALVIDTVRFSAHSKGDDTRSEAIMKVLRQSRDPLQIHGARIDQSIRAKVEDEIEKKVSDAFRVALELEQQEVNSAD